MVSISYAYRYTEDKKLQSGFKYPVVYVMGKYLTEVMKMAVRIFSDYVNEKQ